MDRTTENLQWHELIGLRVRVVASSDPSLLGLEGEVVDETMKLIRVWVGGKRIKGVPKACTKLEFLLPDGSSKLLEGNSLLKRPEDRARGILR